jgi:hypothetical protein
MKNFILFVVLLLLSSCALTTRQSDSEEKEQYITNRKGIQLIDLCSTENMPRYPYRPKITAREIKKLTEAQMDERIKKHIADLEAHIDKVEEVVVETRKRVEACR